jgi:hypothetical protein
MRLREATMAWWWLATSAMANPTIEVAAPGDLTSEDIEVFVRHDGTVYLGDEIILPAELTQRINALVKAQPSLRVVVDVQPKTPFGLAETVLGYVRDSEAPVALALKGAALTGDDPLFPGAGAVTELGEGLSEEQVDLLKPKHHRLPQNPYGTIDFTAYTLEFGEARIGLVDAAYGVAPRIQLGTLPVLDFAGVPNISLKANIFRSDRLDGALGASYTYIPLGRLAENTGLTDTLGFSGSVDGEQLFTSTAGIATVIGAVSWRVADPATLHLKVLYARASASGLFNLGSLPIVLAPGLEATGDELVPRLVGEGASFNLAFDYRFNRRDSLIFRFRGPVFGSARGEIDSSNVGVPGDFTLVAAYRDWVNPISYYSATVGWQFQWRHLEARIGVGSSYPQFLWLLQTFDIGYRFGGKTRRDETVLRKGFRSDVQELEEGGVDQSKAPPPKR